jgi:hypothetical protein
MKFRQTTFIRRGMSSAVASWLSLNSIGTNQKLKNLIAVPSFKDFLYLKVYSKINPKSWIRKQRSSLIKWSVTKCGPHVFLTVHKAQRCTSTLHFTQRLKSMIIIFTQRWPLSSFKMMTLRRLLIKKTRVVSTLVIQKMKISVNKDNPLRSALVWRESGLGDKLPLKSMKSRQAHRCSHAMK